MTKMMIVLAAIASFSAFADEAMDSNTASTHVEKTEKMNDGSQKKSVKSKMKNDDGTTTTTKHSKKVAPTKTDSNDSTEKTN
jgi:hypothetical protein